MTSLMPALRSRVVGDLSCQRDSYLQTLDSEVVSCVKLSTQVSNQPINKVKSKATDGSSTNGHAPASKNLWLIECADSVLFPEGGGQPSDYGTLTPLTDYSPSPIPITSVQRQGLQCILHSPEPLSPGTLVHQEVDFLRRWDHMQQHTGQHLLSAIMDKYENLETLGWGMGAENDINYVDLPRRPSEDEMQSIQEKCNDAIQKNIEITVETSDNVKTDKLPGDYDREKGVIRVIKIGDIDSNPCCGTHLRQTSHISLILLDSTQSVHSGRCRMFFIAGDRAIRLATSSIHSVRSIAKVMSSTTDPAELLANVNKVKNTAADLRKKEMKLLAEIAKYEAESVKGLLRTGMNAFVYRAVQGLDFINSVVFDIKEVIKGGSVVILASGEGSKGGHIVVVGNKDTLEGFVTKIKEIIPGVKGGGKGERWQGKVLEWKKGELEALEKLTAS